MLMAFEKKDEQIRTKDDEELKLEQSLVSKRKILNESLGLNVFDRIVQN